MLDAPLYVLLCSARHTTGSGARLCIQRVAAAHPARQLPRRACIPNRSSTYAGPLVGFGANCISNNGRSKCDPGSSPALFLTPPITEFSSNPRPSLFLCHPLHGRSGRLSATIDLTGRPDSQNRVLVCPQKSYPSIRQLVIIFARGWGGQPQNAVATVPKINW